ncbi:MAG: hypothetical protein HY868_17810 [Chloroflexi bacterium]|nr:hypothetical protein [Chloroflexota bacterium]
MKHNRLTQFTRALHVILLVTLVANPFINVGQAIAASGVYRKSVGDFR